MIKNNKPDATQISLGPTLIPITDTIIFWVRVSNDSIGLSETYWAHCDRWAHIWAHGFELSRIYANVCILCIVDSCVVKDNTRSFNIILVYCLRWPIPIVSPIKNGRWVHWFFFLNNCQFVTSKYTSENWFESFPVLRICLLFTLFSYSMSVTSFMH